MEISCVYAETSLIHYNHNYKPNLAYHVQLTEKNTNIYFSASHIIILYQQIF